MNQSVFVLLCCFMSCLLRLLLFVFYGVYSGDVSVLSDAASCLVFYGFCCLMCSMECIQGVRNDVFVFCWYSYVFIWWFKSWYKYFSEQMFHYFFWWVHPTIGKSSPRERWNSSINSASSPVDIINVQQIPALFNHARTSEFSAAVNARKGRGNGPPDVLSLRSPTGCGKHIRTHQAQHQGYLDISYARSLKGKRTWKDLCPSNLF